MEILKPRPLCLPCTIRTAYDVAKKSTGDEKLQKKIILEVAKWLSSNPISDFTPAALHTWAYRIAVKISGDRDPFLKLKRFSNERALRVAASFERELLAGGDDEETFRLAVRMAICGNAVDFEVEEYGFSLEKFDSQFCECLKAAPVIDHSNMLMQCLERSRKVLYLLDNAGEIVFDKLLIEIIKRMYNCDVLAVVKEGPILNDALLEDAEEVGLTSIVNVITTGNDHIGVDLASSSRTFKDHLASSDMIIAKGQGCYETLSEIESSMGKPIFYLLKAKCSIVAQDLNVPQGSNVIKFSRI